MASTSLATRLLMAATEAVTSAGVGNCTYSANQGAKRHADRPHAHQVEFGLFLPVWMAEPPTLVVPKASGFDESTAFKDECVRPSLAEYVHGHGFCSAIAGNNPSTLPGAGPLGNGGSPNALVRPPHSIGACLTMAERISRPSVGFCILEVLPAQALTTRVGC